MKMIQFKKDSISGRLNAILWVFAGILLITFVLFSGYIASSTYQDMVRRMQTLASILAVNIEAPLVFSDNQSAEENLRALSAIAEVSSAGVLNSKGETLALYEASQNSLKKLPDAIQILLQPIFHNTLRLEQPIFAPNHQDRELEQDIIGKVWIEADLSKDWMELALNLSAFILMVSVIYGLGRMLNHKLIFGVIRPLEELALTANDIKQNKEYDKRVLFCSNIAELNELVDGFNQMLDQIQSRDKELQAQRDLLEQEVMERTKDLLHAKEIAEAASLAKSQFLANMSHEIRTPMNGVLGMLELLCNSEMKPQQQRFADIAYQSAESLLAILNDILDFSKIEAGSMTLEFVDFDLYDLIAQVTEVFTHPLHIKRLSLECQVSADVPRLVSGDAQHLRQILFNLLSNAVKFTQKGKVVLSVEPVSNPYNLRFSIQDSGIGIHQDALSRLFTPFTQADSSTTRQYGGTGLGLAIFKKLVELMGGEVHVDSTPGIGSNFSFILDLTPITSPSAESHLIEEEIPEAVYTPPGLNVLLVEDNPVNQLVSQAIFQSLGCRVRLAENGKIAVALFLEERPDVIFMDCQMPVMDGYAATRIIRQHEQDKGIRRVPIIAVTAHAFLGDRQKCLDADMDDYLAKPFHRQQLQELLKHWMSNESVKSAEQMHSIQRDGMIKSMA